MATLCRGNEVRRRGCCCGRRVLGRRRRRLCPCADGARARRRHLLALDRRRRGARAPRGEGTAGSSGNPGRVMRSRLWLALAATLVTTGAGLYNAEPAAALDWCGAEVAVDQPDTLGGNLVHVVYAVPSDGPDRFGERASPIARDLGAVADWWRGQDA